MQFKTVAQQVAKPPRQSFIGTVIGTKMQKTAKVRVEKNRLHPIVLKNIVYHKTFLVHDPNEECVLGDVVRINSCLKISKLKNFIVAEVVRPAKRFTDDDGITFTQKTEVKRKPSIAKQLEMYGKAPKDLE